MTILFKQEANQRLNVMRDRLIRGVRTSTHPLASVKIVRTMFEISLDTVLPLGELDYAGRDPDNLMVRK